MFTSVEKFPEICFKMSRSIMFVEAEFPLTKFLSIILSKPPSARVESKTFNFDLINLRAALLTF